MDDMLKDFVVEALELSSQVEEYLLQLERDPNNKETLNAVFRSFHTIKGGAGFMNLEALVSACHLTENLFDALRTGVTPVTPLSIEAALQASTFVDGQLTHLAHGKSIGNLQPMPDELAAILKDAIGGQPKSLPIQKVVQTLTHEPPANNELLVDGAKLDWVAMYQAIVPYQKTSDFGQTNSAVRVNKASGKDWNGPADSGKEGGKDIAKTQVKEDSIRVDAAKLDDLLEVAGESVQAANQAGVLLEKLLQFKFEDQCQELMSTLAETVERASRYSVELQRATLATRMQPVGRLFQKFPRLVRELARDLGKEVELEVEGAETEVDRVVVDSLYDPLVHMLRNALDHGIENPQERLEAGKSIKSTLSLRAWQEANSVMIVLADDGKGMDPNQLRAKAIDKGLISEFATLTPEESYQLVFLPGFSTKEVASSVSGRGVGMDVVKTAVEKNRGTIRIDSELGKGTSFAIRLPIELSIVPTMLVNVSGAELALPMSVVERVVELPEEFMKVRGGPVLKDQGRPLPVRSLARALGYEPGSQKVGLVIIAQHPYILAVDTVEGTADLVIKPLTSLAVRGVSGTARSAEGELVLVVGLSFLLDGCNS